MALQVPGILLLSSRSKNKDEEKYIMTFEDFKLDEQILEAISYMGIEKPTPIQELAIPEILKGNDLLACAQTGTGKTAAFVLPILHKLVHEKSEGLNTLIIVPTRELAMQIDQQIHGISYFTNTECAVLYGGGDAMDWAQEQKALTSGANIIVATPGKLKAHLNMGYANFENLKHLILDEADRMLDIGFFDDIMKIISYLPKKRQNLMFSATMPPKVQELANQILTDPVEVKTEISKPAEGVLQAAYLVHEGQKLPVIHSLIGDKPEYDSILVFTSTKKKVSEITRSLRKAESNVEGISSDLEQKDRENVLLAFKAKRTRILVATDVLSRGIDIKGIDLIINYDVPGDAEDYVHRVGRTARAKATGVALTMVNGDDMYKLYRIEQLIEQEIMKLPLPPGIGKGPEWNPKGRPSAGRGYQKGRKKSNSPRRK